MSELRCHKCKYQEIPPKPVYPPLITSLEASPFSPRENIEHFVRKLRAQSAHRATPEGQGFSCYQCGHIFDLDDIRWEGDSYTGTYGGYIRSEPFQVWTIRTEMYTRADHGNQEAREHLAARKIPEYAWEGFARMKFQELMDNLNR